MSDKKQISIWADGCFDGGHPGHANLLRQARTLGDRLIVGVHSDEQISLHKKCEPLFSESERYTMIRAMKWVDEVVEDAPYITLPQVLKDYGAQYCAHGSDITTSADGTDTYKLVKEAQMYKEVDRTLGVSTTDIIQRILRIGKSESLGADGDDDKIPSSYTGNSPFLLTTDKMMKFCSPIPKKNNQKVVYTSGAFDIFHPGHIGFLKSAKEQGDYLIVGVLDDSTVKAYKGSNYPIMSLSERIMSLLACRYVDEVIFQAPYTISQEILEEFDIKVVAHGLQEVPLDPSTGKDPYAIAKDYNIFKILDSGSSLTTPDIIARVESRRGEFEKRNVDKQKKEIAIIAASETKKENGGSNE